MYTSTHCLNTYTNAKHQSRKTKLDTRAEHPAIKARTRTHTYTRRTPDDKADNQTQRQRHARYQANFTQLKNDEE